jgi:hypothetical protein
VGLILPPRDKAPERAKAGKTGAPDRAKAGTP